GGGGGGRGGGGRPGGGVEPRCTGMCAAWATSRPAPSKSAHEKSRRSLMFGERPVRPSTTPISSATPASRWCAISRSIAFINYELPHLELYHDELPHLELYHDELP